MLQPCARYLLLLLQRCRRAIIGFRRNRILLVINVAWPVRRRLYLGLFLPAHLRFSPRVRITLRFQSPSEVRDLFPLKSPFPSALLPR